MHAGRSVFDTLLKPTDLSILPIFGGDYFHFGEGHRLGLLLVVLFLEVLVEGDVQLRLCRGNAFLVNPGKTQLIDV